MTESDFISSREPISDQYVITQRLYAELEQEREASATAASEALSMILRLQGEKAAEKLEACQYKRMAEEKIHHAEVSLAILEELLYQKEMEIASLKFQVQTYRDRALKPGMFSPTSSGMDVFKIPPLRKTDAFVGNMNFHGTVRSISLPVVRYKSMCSEMDTIDEDVLSLQIRQPIQEHFNNFFKEVDDKENAGTQCIMCPDVPEVSPTSTCEVHCEQFPTENKYLEKKSETRRMKNNTKSSCLLEHPELQMSIPTASMSTENECKSCSWSSALSSNSFNDSTIEVAETKNGIDVTSSCSESEGTDNFRDFDSHYSSCLGSEWSRKTVHSSSIHDIFEVPQDDNHNEAQDGLFKYFITENNDAPSALYSTGKDVRGCYLKDDEWLTKGFQGGHCGTILYLPRKGQNHNCASSPKIGVSSQQSTEELCQLDVRQLEKRLQVLEGDRRAMMQEDSERKEQLKLLKEISEQIRVIHSQIKKPEKKASYKDDISVVSIMEAMLSFSI